MKTPINERGLNKENISRLVKWSGWAEELPWLLFTVFVLFSAYGYYSDIKQCQNMMGNNCYQNCRLNELQRQFELENPGMGVSCYIDNTTNHYQCNFAGTKETTQHLSEEFIDVLNKINKINLTNP